MFLRFSDSKGSVHIWKASPAQLYNAIYSCSLESKTLLRLPLQMKAKPRGWKTLANEQLEATGSLWGEQVLRPLPLKSLTGKPQDTMK